MVESFQNFSDVAKTQEKVSPWYDHLRYAEFLVECNHFIGFEDFLKHSQCRTEFGLALGVVDILSEVLANHENLLTRRSALEFLTQLYQDCWIEKQDSKQESFIFICIEILKIIRVYSQDLNSDVSFVAREQMKVLVRLKSNVLETKEVYEKLNTPNRYNFKKKLRNDLFLIAKKSSSDTTLAFSQWKSEVLTNSEIEKALDLYITANGTLTPSDVEKFDLEKNIIDFLRNDESKVMLLLGGSGSGKSFFLQYIEHLLWKNIDFSRKESDDYIPLLIGLPSIRNLKSGIVEEALNQKGLSSEQIKILQGSRKFLFMLDGYDEVQGSENFYLTNQLDCWQAKVIITCRNEYLMGASNDYRYQFIPYKSKKPMPHALCIRYIASFSQSEIDKYLERYVQICKPVWKNWQQYRTYLDTLPGLKHLVETPFLLYIIAEVLPVLAENKGKISNKITRRTLYEAFVTQWFERGVGKLTTRGELKLLGRNPMKTLSEYSQKLAMGLYQTGSDAIQYEEDKKSSWDEFFKDEPRLNAIRLTCPIKKIGNNVYSFLHYSLLEYLIVSHVLDNLKKILPVESEDGRDRKYSKDTPTSDVRVTTGTKVLINDDLISKFLNIKLLNNRPSIVNFLVDTITDYPVFQNHLWAIIEHSKIEPKVAIAAANAATVLNAAKISFSGKNLVGVRIPGSNLSFSLLDRAQLQNADLQGVDFQGSWLRNADFRGRADAKYLFRGGPLLGSRSSDSSYHDFTNRFRYCCYSPDGQWVALGCSNNQIYVYKVKTKELVTILKDSDTSTSSIACIVFITNTQLIACGNRDRYIRIWDIVSKQCLKTLNGHEDRVINVAINFNKQIVASTGLDKTIRLWNISGQNQQCINVLEGHSKAVYAAIFHPNNKNIISASEDSTIRIWDITGKDQMH